MKRRCLVCLAVALVIHAAASDGTAVQPEENFIESVAEGQGKPAFDPMGISQLKRMVLRDEKDATVAARKAGLKAHSLLKVHHKTSQILKKGRESPTKPKVMKATKGAKKAQAAKQSSIALETAHASKESHKQHKTPKVADAVMGPPPSPKGHDFASRVVANRIRSSQ